MAARRIKMLTNNHYVQPLKVEFKNKMVLTPSASYNSVLVNLKHRASQDTEFSVKAWLRFNSNTFDGVQMIGSLVKGKNTKSIASCAFKITAS
jgi:hypothetical protein